MKYFRELKTNYEYFKGCEKVVHKLFNFDETNFYDLEKNIGDPNIGPTKCQNGGKGDWTTRYSNGYSVNGYNNYTKDSISMTAVIDRNNSTLQGSYEYNGWIGFWIVEQRQGPVEQGTEKSLRNVDAKHLWVTNAPEATHVGSFENGYERDLIHNVKGYTVGYIS